jgi:hypothetical protein
VILLRSGKWRVKISAHHFINVLPQEDLTQSMDAALREGQGTISLQVPV